MILCNLQILSTISNDLVVIGETEEDLIKRLNEWKNNVEIGE